MEGRLPCFAWRFAGYLGFDYRWLDGSVQRQRIILREQRLTEYSAFLTAMNELEEAFDELVVANTADAWEDVPSPLQEQRALDADALGDLQSAYSRLQLGRV